MDRENKIYWSSDNFQVKGTKTNARVKENEGEKYAGQIRSFSLDLDSL